MLLIHELVQKTNLAQAADATVQPLMLLLVMYLQRQRVVVHGPSPVVFYPVLMLLVHLDSPE